MKNEIRFTRINNDVNGNPRYVCHFLNFITEEDKDIPLSEKYQLALRRAKKLDGKKFHNRQYGGGIVFQCYNLPDLEKSILNQEWIK